jgi:ferrous iron transport protein B
MMASLPARPDRIALLGNPNCGKTALFNLLTGSRQKVANYAGVTVERKEGVLITPSGHRVTVLDLPGAYSLNAVSTDEAVTRDVITGHSSEALPDLLVCVTDATNLRLHLRLVLEARRLGLPLVVALNKMDRARQLGIIIDRERLSRELNLPVVETVSVHAHGADALRSLLDEPVAPGVPSDWSAPGFEQVMATQRDVQRIYRAVVTEPTVDRDPSDRMDRFLMHPVWGFAVLALVLFVTFLAVFSGGDVLTGLIEEAFGALAEVVSAGMADGPLRGLLVEGLIGGVGGVIVFLPQILILFLIILALESSGYLPRAAFLLDHLMGKVGLSGRAFIPLLSSFACAVPGIMATRTIRNPRERLVTIMIAPLMTCSARLPVYALIIAAFVPEREVGGLFNLQGIVLFALYVAGVVSAMAVGFVLKRFGSRDRIQPLLMELPDYHLPHVRSLAIGLWERARIFLARVGGIILSLMILLWFLSSFPAPPPGATEAPITYSFAGMLGRALEVVFAPIGFNWQIAIALVPGLAAREVAVGALGTVYALSQTGDDIAQSLLPIISQTWTLPTALSLLAWYVFAPQCISTLGVVKRETNSWRYPALMAGYLFGLAYVAAFVTYRVALAWGGA